MYTFITMALFGIVISVIGICNMRGNISSLHWYHRQRVSEENVKPFGKLVGLGTLIIGLSVMIYGGFFLIVEKMQNEMLILIGTGLLFVGLAVGMVLSFYAMIKYNKGIF